ncbi:hypothetical protein NHQ30_000010 [Ciborinia camelliae]|nr:hypothetical protein NHQ30_000010 [Ciborinia camelliae]
MAIITGIDGQVEVRIKSYLGQGYGEYIKLEPKEKSTDLERERYIVIEPHTAYYAQVKLKEGFDFGEFQLLQVSVFLNDEMVAYRTVTPPENGSKIKKTIKEKIEVAEFAVGGQKVGSELVFKRININGDETPSREIGDSGIPPRSFPTIQVKFCYFKKITVTRSEDEFNGAMSKWQKVCSKLRSASRDLLKFSRPLTENDQSDIQNLQDAEKVHQNIHQNHGSPSIIASAEVSKQPKAVLKKTGTEGESIKLPDQPLQLSEDAGFFKDQPPLYLYAWHELEKKERSIAIEQLQDLEMDNWNSDQKGRTRQVPGLRNNRYRLQVKDDDPWEWRSCFKMYEPEKFKAFEKLQERRKARERGEVLLEYRNMKGEIVSLGKESNTGVQMEEPPAEEESDSVSLEDNTKALPADRMPVAALFEDDLETLPAEETPAAIQLEPNTEYNSTETTTPNQDKPITQQVKNKPIATAAHDSDDDIIFISERKVPQVQGFSKSKPGIKQEAAESHTEELESLKQEEKKVEQEIEFMSELWDKKRKRNELKAQIDAVEAKRIKKEK